MHTQRMAELCFKACDLVTEVVDQLEEFTAARAAGGSGTHRDPTNILAELQEEIRDLRAVVREQCDEIERETRTIGSARAV
jgi:hypothetical protein